MYTATFSRLLLMLVTITLFACKSATQGGTCLESLSSDSINHRTECQKEFSSKEKLSDLRIFIRALGKDADAGMAMLEKLVASLENTPLYAHALLESSWYLEKHPDSEIAFGFLEQSAALFEREKSYSDQSSAYHRLYLLEWRKSNHQGALEYASKAREAAVLGKDSNAEIKALNAFFNVFEEVGSLGPAQQALAILSEKFDENTALRHRINASIAQGRLHISRKEYALGEHNFQKALAAAKDSKNRAALRGLHLNIVSANTFLDRFEIAQQHLDIAWSYANEDGSATYALLFYQALLEHKQGLHDASFDTMQTALLRPDLPDIWEWEMHFWAGNAAHSIGKVDQALVSYRKSINASKKLRGDMQLNQLKAHMMARKREPYEALFIELFDSGQLEEAFNIAEETKASGFLDAYVTSGELASSAQRTLTSSRTIVERVDGLQQYLNLMKQSPLSWDGNRSSFGDLARSLFDRQLLSYFVASERVFIFLLSSGSLKGMELTISRSELERLVFDMESKPNSADVLSAIGRVVLPSPIVLNAGHVYISSDSILNGVAFSSLIVDGQYLAEKYSVSLIPGANALALMVSNRGGALKFQGQNILGNADGDLPSAMLELTQVAEALTDEPKVGGQASLVALFSNSHPEILHVATHSGVSHLGPWLRLSDGQVTGVELIAKGLRPKLAVLASCASGAGQGKYLWGSLGGALLSNGANSVLVTLRSVEDSVTSKIILDFYHSYMNGTSAAESLRMAQAKARKRGVATSDWSAYALIGLHDTHYSSPLAGPSVLME